MLLVVGGLRLRRLCVSQIMLLVPSSSSVLSKAIIEQEKMCEALLILSTYIVLLTVAGITVAGPYLSHGPR